jgi:hypothetical protein
MNEKDHHDILAAAGEQAVVNSCVGESTIVSYPYAAQVRYCGCALGEVEQNYTPAEVNRSKANGTFSELNTQSESAINQYCESLL